MHHVQSLNWTRTCIRQRLPLPSIPTLGSFPCIPGVYWEKYWVSEPSPDPCLHSAADIRCHTSPSGGVHTYMHIPKYVLAITNPFIAFPCHCHLPSRHASPLSWTTNSQCPGTTPISHRVSKLETHIFVIITHLGAQVDSWVCRGRHFDERETAALVLVVSRTWGGGGLCGGCEHMPFIIRASCSKLIQFTKGASVKFGPLTNTARNTFVPPLVWEKSHFDYCSVSQSSPAIFGSSKRGKSAAICPWFTSLGREIPSTSVRVSITVEETPIQLFPYKVVPSSYFSWEILLPRYLNDVWE